MSSVFSGRIALRLHDNVERFWGQIKTPNPEDDPCSKRNRAAALSEAAYEYFRSDAHERAVFWTDASMRRTNDFSTKPEGGAEGDHAAAAVVWRRPLPDGGWEWADEVQVYRCECCPEPDCWSHPCTIRRAEMKAVLMALKRGYASVRAHQHERVVAIYTDNLRVVDTIRAYRRSQAGPPGPHNWSRDLLREIVRVTNDIRSQGVEVELQWIPRGQIQGNKIADFLARNAAGMWPPHFELQWNDEDEEQVDRLRIWHILNKRDRERAVHRPWMLCKSNFRNSKHLA
ncbi:hypothetical protein DBV05_g5389 [Lasiodiplodia theobromae]|uniref:RNase H type-1 domain-containing protein n=1 Tax=Lasiodiplodia theobromae TaxID=45133 RepID=A0A5N5DE90_9PEZI|nr:hypothetical protein DBV05_g5389 [Lasiodiplodia theobromae]